MNKETIEEMVRRIDFPHLRAGGEWMKPGGEPHRKQGFSFDRLCYYGKQLRQLGMPDADIASMFSDLYWDASDEFRLNQTPM